MLKIKPSALAGLSLLLTGCVTSHAPSPNLDPDYYNKIIEAVENQEISPQEAFDQVRRQYQHSNTATGVLVMLLLRHEDLRIKKSTVATNTIRRWAARNHAVIQPSETENPSQFVREVRSQADRVRNDPRFTRKIELPWRTAP